MIVLDANVFAKLLVSERDSSEARDLVYAIHRAAIPVVLPSLFIYEVVQIGRYYDLGTDIVLDFLETQLVGNWQVVEPSRKHWKMAQKISETGSANSGYPAMYDSIYHALALEEGANFITADKKHFAKAHTFGRIYLLADWPSGIGPLPH